MLLRKQLSPFSKQCFPPEYPLDWSQGSPRWISTVQNVMNLAKITEVGAEAEDPEVATLTGTRIPISTKIRKDRELFTPEVGDEDEDLVEDISLRVCNIFRNKV